MHATRLMIFFCLTSAAGLGELALGTPAESGWRGGQPGQGVAYGNLKIHPQFKIWGEYDDNIFWAETEKEDDFIITVSPGLNLEFPWEKNLIRLNYWADLRYFIDHPAENHANHLLESLLSYSFSDYTIKLEDIFRKTSARADTEFRDRVRRIENSGWAKFICHFNQLQLEAGYRNYYLDYEQSSYERFDHQEHLGSIAALYDVASKTKGLLEYNYNRILYRESRERDGYYNEVRGGLVGEITAKLFGTIKVGYQSRDYPDPELDDFGGLVGFVSLEVYFSPYTDLKLGWEKTLRESTYADNNFYKINRAWLRLSQQLIRKVRGFAEVRYANQRYPAWSPLYGKKRDDDVWIGSAGVKYQIQPWMETELRYTYNRRDSNIPGQDYGDNVIALQLSTYY